MSDRPAAAVTDSIELMERWRHGHDEWAFAALVRNHIGWMRGTALRMLQDTQLAAEAVQDALTLLARKKPRCPCDAMLTAWLHRTVVFTARNIMAKEHRHHRRTQAVANLAPCLGEAPDALPEEALAALDATLNDLPSGDRTLITARYLHRESWEAVAAGCGLSPEAARKRATRVLERIAGVLRMRGIAMPGAALTAALAAKPTTSCSAADAAAAAQQACSASVTLPGGILIQHTLILMNAPKLIALTAAACLLLSAVPMTILTQRTHAAESRAHAALLSAQTPPEKSRLLSPALLTKNPPTPAPTLITANAPPSATSPPGSPPWLQALGESLTGIAAGAAGPADSVNAALVSAVGAVMTDPDRNRRNAGLQFLMQWLRPADVTAVREAMNKAQKQGVFYVNESNALRERWAAIDGRAAMLDYTEGRTDNGWNRLHSAIARGWASTDPDGFMAWLKTLPPECDWPEKSAQDFFQGLLSTDPARATTLLLRGDARTIRGGLPRIADRIMEEGGTPALEQWRASLPVNANTAEGRAAVAWQIAEARTFQSPQEVIGWLTKLQAEGGMGDIPGRLGTRFGQASQTRLIEVLQTLPADSPVAQAISQTFWPTLATKQPNSAASWLNENRASPLADDAADALARAVRGRDPDAATRWAATIRNPQRRATVEAALAKP